MNRVTLIGRIVNDLEVKKTANDISVVSFTVAVSRDRKDENGNYPSDFFNVVAWRQTADYMGRTMAKGTLVGVDGKLTTRKYTNNEGRNVQVVEIVANEVQKLTFNKKEEEKEEPKEEFTSSPKVEINPDELPFY